MAAYKKCNLSEITLRANIYSKFVIKHFGELTGPWVDKSATWLTVSWFVGELSCCHHNFFSSQVVPFFFQLPHPTRHNIFHLWQRSLTDFGILRINKSLLPTATTSMSDYLTQLPAFVCDPFASIKNSRKNLRIKRPRQPLLRQIGINISSRETCHFSHQNIALGLYVWLSSYRKTVKSYVTSTGCTSATTKNSFQRAMTNIFVYNSTNVKYYSKFNNLHIHNWKSKQTQYSWSWGIFSDKAMPPPNWHVLQGAVKIAFGFFSNCTRNWCVIGPLETVQKRASTLFPQVKNHQLLCARQYWYQ